MSKMVTLRGLPFRATPDDIRSFFKSEVGNPEPHVNIVNVDFLMGPDGRPNGEANVELATELDCEKATYFNRQHMGHRYVEVRRAFQAPVMPMLPMMPMVPPPTIEAPAPKDPSGSRDRDRDDDRDRDRRDRDRDRDRDRRDRSRSRDRDRDRRSRRSRSRSRDRKDRSETPPRRERKKKSSNWDAPPDPATAAIEPTANNPQLTFKARRIYVGNLPQQPQVDDVALREFFDQAMQQAGLTSGGGSCVSDVWISGEKQFAFVEVRTVQEANNAMQLDGITLYGQPLRINRPHDYVPPNMIGTSFGFSQANPTLLNLAGAAAGAAPGVLSNMSNLMQMTKKCRRVHIGNLPMNIGLTPGQLKTFVSGIMQQLCLIVKAGDPVIDSFVSTDGKFGFVEMRTVQEATNALSMSGVDFMGRPIRVGRPADYVPPTPDVIMQCEGTGILGIPGDLGVEEFPGAGAAAGPDMAQATTVVEIQNMLSEAEVNDEQECKEIAEETVEKCQADFGAVTNLIIVRPGKEGVEPSMVGKVFVEFADMEAAKKAAAGLNHVKFDDRTVVTGFEAVDKFEALKALFPEQVKAPAAE
mmetsp:Transcript_9676/g.22337  ORF Transcript_9676/g.22337 Transcript_9676/m.22337 type:complete len:583 (+) Transcript_9676:120-1868(+)